MPTTSVAVAGTATVSSDPNMAILRLSVPVVDSVVSLQATGDPLLKSKVVPAVGSEGPNSLEKIPSSIVEVKPTSTVELTPNTDSA